MRKIWVLVTVVVSILLLTFTLFQISRIRSYDNGNTFKHIPAGAAIIIKAKNIEYLQDGLLTNIKYNSELKNSAIIANALSPLSELDSIKWIENNAFEDFKDYPLYISFHAQGKQNVKLLYLIELPNKREEAKLKGLVEKLNNAGYTISSRKYNSRTIYQVSNNRDSWYIHIDEGIALASTSHLLIEATIRQQQDDSDWTKDKSFQKVSKTIGAGSHLNLFVDFNHLDNVLKPICGKDSYSKLKKLSEQSNWAEFDVEINSDDVLMNGFISGNDQGIYSCLLTNAQPQRINISDVLPTNTRAYISLSLDNGDILNNKLQKYFNSHEELDYNSIVQKIEKRYKFNFTADFFKVTTGKIALAYSDYNHLQPDANGLLIVKLKSSSRGKETILQMLQKMYANNGGVSAIKTFHPDDELSFKIYKGFTDDVLKHTFGEFLPKVPQKYIAFYEDNLICADAPSLIEQFIYNNILSRTLGNSKAHQAFLSNFSSHENMFVFCETGHFNSLLADTFEPLFADLNENQKEALNNFYAIGSQYSGTGNMIYSTSYLKYLPSRESEPRTVWQSLLDTTVYTKPVLVKNHYTKEREVIVQDEANNLYLLSNSGRIQWKKPLDSKIMSEVIQIDYYRNNKLQYLFNTKNSIYLLDRNGNHVANYPVRLPSPATNGIAVFDYDNNRKYRIFIACANQKIYLYNNKGNIVSGWKFDKTEGKVEQAIQHFRSNNKDYIAFADDKRNYICDRKGKIRVKLQQSFTRNPQSAYYLVNKNTSNDCIVTSDIKGNIKKIKLADGSVKTQEIDAVEEYHRLEVFDINNRPHYMFSTKDKVICYDMNGKDLFDKEFDKEINLKVDRYQFSSNNIKFGINEPKSGNIYLLNSNGKTYKGFPLKGYSRFSIGFLKSGSTRFNLIVGGSENYIYNYQVD